MLTNDQLHDYLELLGRAGLGDVELYYVESESTRASVRDRKVENVVQSLSRGLGIRALKDGRLAFTHTTDLSPAGIDAAAVNLAAFQSVTEPDEHNCFAEPAPPAGMALDSSDGGTADAAKLAEYARGMAEYALSVANVSLAETRADARHSRVRLLSTRGVDLSHEGTMYEALTKAHAHKDDLKEVAYSYASARHFEDLYAPCRIGNEAGEWARDRLGADALPTGDRPVVFMPMAGGSMVEYLTGALNGEMVNMGVTFMVGKLGETIASPLVQLIEDPLMKRGVETAPWDGEGTPTMRKHVVDAGKLKTYFHNIKSASKAGAVSTANAARGGFSSLPGIGSLGLFMENGKTPVDKLIGEVEDGLLVYMMMGHGPDMSTGVLSMGASGWEIKGGKAGKPVSKVTIAGNMIDIFKGIDAVGNDLDLARPYRTPTFRVAKMSVSGT
jgi:PmbA protein